KPQVSVTSLTYRADVAVGQPVGGRVGGERRAVEPAESSGGGDPGQSRLVLIDGADAVVGGPGPHRVSGDVLIAHSVQTVWRADPEVALPAFRNCQDVVTRQAVLRGIGGEFFLFPADEAAVGSHPQVAVVVFKQGLNGVALYGAGVLLIEN